MNVKPLSKTDLLNILDQADVVLVDVRPAAAYNGWQLQGEHRGGHIRSAISFPLTWLEHVSPRQHASFLASKGIEPGRTIVVYGYHQDDVIPFVEKLHALGYADLRVYSTGLADWAADEQLPMERLPRYEKLVYPEWVHQLIRGRRPQNYAGTSHLLFHVNFGVPQEYEDSHLPGALYLDTNLLESQDTWNRRSPQELRQSLASLGIRADSTVVLCGRDSVPPDREPWPGRHAGQIAATRAAAILMYAGVGDVRLLDGGYDGWVSAGYPVETQPNLPTPVESFGADIPANPQYFLDLEEARSLLADPNGRLVSIRTWAEYTGDVSGYNYIGPRGRIPGAVWGNCGSDAYHMQHYRSPENTMRAYREIAANWRAAGIRPENKVAFYCGTGWRASETFFYAYLMGWPNVSIYDGGWFEWSSDPANPIEAGVPDGEEKGTAGEAQASPPGRRVAD